MIPEPLPPPLDLQRPNVPASPEEVLTRLKKSNRFLKIIIGVVLFVICCFSVVCVVFFGTAVRRVMIERAPVSTVLDDFLEAMAAKDVERAYTMFSPRAQRQFPVDDLESLLEGNNYMLFENYQSLTIQNLNLTVAANTNQDLPQGTVANVTATVTYSDGFTGQLTAVLEKVDDIWMLHQFSIIVPPDKLQP